MGKQRVVLWLLLSLVEVVELTNLLAIYRENILKGAKRFYRRVLDIDAEKHP